MTRVVHFLSAITIAALFVIGIAAQPVPLRILNVDPPNWYATLPKPLLLVRGEGFNGAKFQLSDPKLRLERTVISENGHWAQLWISASPAAAETVELRVLRGAEHVVVPYTFAARRAPDSGMAGFTPRDVMYLIMTDRFADGDLSNDGPHAHSSATSAEAERERANPRGWHGGDLRGIAEHLEYLQSFGVTAVWTTPVYQNHSPVGYHGYHATDYYSVDEHYGSLGDLQSLAEALHAHGMKLVLDTVPNHVGPLHPWVKDSPAPDWFHGTEAQHVAGESNFKALVDPHATAHDRLATLQGWFVNELPDMNTENPAVAQYLRQNTIWWIEQTGADGLRIDTFPYVDREFWHAFHAELRELYPRLTDVGEVSGPDPEVTSAFAGGVVRSGIDTGLYTPFDFPLYHAAKDVFAGGAPFTRFAQVLKADALYPHPERLVPFLDNHDNPRFASTVTDPATQKLAYAFLLTTRGMPQLYSGDEIAMQGSEDPDNRRDFPGGFPGSTMNAFRPAGRTANAPALFDWIAQLTSLRREHPTLACGAEQVLKADQNTFVYLRQGLSGCANDHASASEQIIVALHRGTATRIHVDLRNTAASGCKAQDAWPQNATAEIKDSDFTVTFATEAAIIVCHPSTAF